MIINSPLSIILESPDNCGKSSIVNTLTQKFQDNNINVLTISQPRSCQLGDIIYDLHHQYENIKIPGFSRQLLHVASHLAGYQELKDKPFQVLLSDRSFISSMAYGHAYPTSERTRNFEVQAIFDIETYMMPREVRPTHIFYLDNLPFTKGDEIWENYNKVKEGYAYVRNADWYKKWVKTYNIKSFAVQNKRGALGETVQLIYDLIGG